MPNSARTDADGSVSAAPMDPKPSLSDQNNGWSVAANRQAPNGERTMQDGERASVLQGTVGWGDCAQSSFHICRTLGKLEETRHNMTKPLQLDSGLRLLRRCVSPPRKTTL